MTRRKGEILIPRVDFERAQITTRRAPSPKIGAGIGGWLEWQLIDRQGRAARGGEQHNLFLDQGLDNIAAGGLSVPWDPGTGLYVAVSTDSTEPDVTDTSLAGEIARTGVSAASTATQRVANGVYIMSCEKEFDFGEANGNLTKWGIATSPTPLTGRLFAAELFRDAGGDPIVITKTSDYKLRVAYSLQLNLAPVTPQSGSFTIDGVGLINGEYQWMGGSSTPLDIQAFSRLARGQALAQAGRVAVFDAGLNYNTSPTLRGQADTTFSAFTPGVWERSASGVFPTGQANRTVESIGMLVYGNTSPDRAAGFKFDIDVGDRFTKDNEHTLTINDALTVTWGRS